MECDLPMLKIIFHEAYLTPYFTCKVENPFRVKAIYNKLRTHYETITPEAARKEDLLRIHVPEHIEKVRKEGEDLYRTALLAAGGALHAARLALEGVPAFGIIRPPGHHAGRNHYSGFCFFNNMAVAVSSLLESGQVRKVVIIDIDMHRGDGTHKIFSDEPAVSIIDIWAKDRRAYMDRLSDELDRLPPSDMIAVSAGFDLYVHDWGGRLETRDFHRIGFAVRQTALQKAEGRYFAILEGGYFVNDLGKNALAFCRGLEGKEAEE